MLLLVDWTVTLDVILQFNSGVPMHRPLTIILGCFALSLFVVACGDAAKEYNHRMRTVSDTIKLAGLVSGIMCDTYGDTWAAAIERGYGDFNDDLAKKRSDWETNGTIAAVQARRRWIDSSMKTLAEPPDKSVDGHKKVMEFYGNYTQLYELSVQPAGSLISFRAKVNEVYAKHKQLMNELDVMGLVSPDDTTKVKTP